MLASSDDYTTTEKLQTSGSGASDVDHHRHHHHLHHQQQHLGVFRSNYSSGYQLQQQGGSSLQPLQPTRCTTFCSAASQIGGTPGSGPGTNLPTGGGAGVGLFGRGRSSSSTSATTCAAMSDFTGFSSLQPTPTTILSSTAASGRMCGGGGGGGDQGCGGGRGGGVGGTGRPMYECPKLPPAGFENDPMVYFELDNEQRRSFATVQS